MAVTRITVTELKCACLDPSWRAKWLRGEKPPTISFDLRGEPVHGRVFHQAAEEFVNLLTVDKQVAKTARRASGEGLWHLLYERLAEDRANELIAAGNSLESVYHVVKCLRTFCDRLVELRARTPQFKSWPDVFLVNEFSIPDVRFDFGGRGILVSGRVDAARTHPAAGLEVVDYKLSHGAEAKRDFLQLAIYARLLALKKPGLTPQGSLEYYEPELHETVLTFGELSSLFDEMVPPVLEKLAGAGKSGSARPSGKPDPTREPLAAGPDLSEAIERTYRSFKLEVKVIGQVEAPQLVRYLVKPAEGVKVASLAGRAEDLMVSLALAQPPLIEPVKGAVPSTSPRTGPTRRGGRT
ncbi:MAG: DNA translocase FtsK [Pseudomonadota bacterium]